MFKTLNNGYQRLLTSTVEISIYVVQIISFCLLPSLQNLYRILRKNPLLRIYNINTWNIYVFEHLLCAGSCSRCFTIKCHNKNKNRVLRAHRGHVQAVGEGECFLEVKTSKWKCGGLRGQRYE